jgi:hypothetical protein
MDTMNENVCGWVAPNQCVSNTVKYKPLRIKIAKGIEFFGSRDREYLDSNVCNTGWLLKAMGDDRCKIDADDLDDDFYYFYEDRKVNRCQ